MTFLNPLLLAGLALAAIPFVIHLFNFRRPRKVNFSSLEFIQELKKTTMQKVRIKQWLLLALRTLALCCLALVFARPTLDSGLAPALAGDVRTSIGIVVDNSPSMELRNADGGYFEQATALASTIANNIGPGDDLSLITTSSTEVSTFTTAAQAGDAASRLAIAPSTQSLTDAVRRLGQVLLESGNANIELYVISDGQASTVGDSSAVGSALRAAGYFLQVGSEPPDNVAIESVNISSRIVEQGQPASLTATIRNYGNTVVENYVASAYLNGNRVAQATVEIPAGGTGVAELTITPQSRGWIEGEVRLEEDDFEADNVRRFALHVPDVRRILIVGDEGASLSYVRTAIEAGRADGRALFDVDVVREGQIAGAGIDDYHVVFLVGINGLTSGEVNMISRYVENGGGVVVFPGATLSIADYNQLLNELGGGSIGGYVGARNLQQPVTRLDTIERDHPLFDGVFDPGSDGEVEKPEVYFSVDYQPVRGTEHTLMRLGNGKPLLQEIPDGNGTTLFFSILPEPSWSDLPVRGLFVPLLYRSIYYLSSSASGGFPEVLAGRASQVIIPGAMNEESLTLQNEQGIEYVPEMRSVTGGTQIEITPSMSVDGSLTLRSDSVVVGIVPVNPDPLESNLSQVDGDDLARHLTTVAGFPVVPVAVRGFTPGDLDEMISGARTGVEMWRPLLAAGLILLIIEMLVARMWAPETASAGN